MLSSIPQIFYIEYVIIRGNTNYVKKYSLESGQAHCITIPEQAFSEYSFPWHALCATEMKPSLVPSPLLIL